MAAPAGPGVSAWLLDHPRSPILLEAGLLMAGLCVVWIALGVWILGSDRLPDAVGWIMIVVALLGLPYLAHRLRHPAFDRG